VDDLAFGPFRSVERFHATFEQHCEGAPPALRGEVSVETRPPPPLIQAQVTVDPVGKVFRGSAELSGTVVCDRVAINPSYLIIDLTEVTKKYVAIGAFTRIELASCPTTPISWQATVDRSISKYPFVNGTATVTILTRVNDPFYEERYDDGTMTSMISLRDG
jgi:hypothetical protein